jgi:hypothetical protein
MTHSLSPSEKAVFGADARRHEITGLVLEQGSGCLPDDIQARVLHIPLVAATQGKDVAAAMLIRLDAASRNRHILQGS